MKIIEGEFDRPVSQVFSYISDEPVAAASFGQVIAYSRFYQLLIIGWLGIVWNCSANLFHCTISIRFTRAAQLMVLLWP